MMTRLKRKTITRPVNTTQLYERNFSRLLFVFPKLATFTGRHLAILDDRFRVRISLTNSGRYTSIVSVHCLMTLENKFVTDPFFRLRVYHDAQVAEVIGYQEHGYFKPWYRYPNPNMYQRNEKLQANIFLAELLDFLIKNQARFEAETATTG